MDSSRERVAIECGDAAATASSAAGRARSAPASEESGWRVVAHHRVLLLSVVASVVAAVVARGLGRLAATRRLLLGIFVFAVSVTLTSHAL